jgi:hypothetical protein
VTLEIYSAKSTSAETRWFNPIEVESLPIPSPYRRVIEAIA